MMRMKIMLILLTLLMLAQSVIAATTAVSPTVAPVQVTTATQISTQTTTTTQTQCKTQTELDAEISKCKESGMVYSLYKDEFGCQYVKCYKELKAETETSTETGSSQTTTCADVTKDIEKCKDAGMDYDKYADNDGCTMIKCKKIEAQTTTATTSTAITCTKYDDSKCTYIKCDDGYTFNSCTFCGQAATATTASQGKTAAAPTATSAKTTTQEPPETEDFTDLDNFGQCIKKMIGGANKIDDEVTWSKCKAQYTMSATEEKAIAVMKKCVEDATSESAEIDDEITWSTCWEEGRTQTSAGQTDAEGVKKAASGQETMLNPQPEPPAPGLFGKIGGWFKGIFGK
ncbi:hypothetical protein KY363_06135 [Candidatus Woesearchaeota archaeon]|nr:hypothetical protein [Candidatus Woesearchaeota archaeon]